MIAFLNHTKFRVSRGVLLLALMKSGFLSGSVAKTFTDPEPYFGQNREEQISELIQKMSLAEKIGQMTQANKAAVDKHPTDIERLYLGSILSGGGEAPAQNTVEGWRQMVRDYQSRAMMTRLKIPLVYGTDAVHGHGNAMGAVIFPHNIGLGAGADASLVQSIGALTGRELAATGIHWNFAPAVSVPLDVRWGRTYEGFSEDTNLVTHLATAYLKGLQTYEESRNTFQVLGTGKHFVGDGGTTWGSSHNEAYQIDQGDTPVDEEELRRVHLKPYKYLIDAGVQTIMVSYSSWQGQYMHSHKYLLTDVLKNEMRFDGLVISDWMGVFVQGGTDAKDKVARSINAGIDMVMAAYEYRSFIKTLTEVVQEGRVPMARIDDAVRRILRVKMRYGLLPGFPPLMPEVEGFGSQKHRDLARVAVQKSAVLLKNANVLPLTGSSKHVVISGRGANDIGLQSGGWTLKWQGHRGNLIPGTSIYQALKNDLPDHWSLSLKSEHTEDAFSSVCHYGVMVAAEDPYAEGQGDHPNPSLSDADLNEIRILKNRCQQTVLIVLSGRPVALRGVVSEVDALIAAWLPGSEGAGLADLIYGRVPFSGKMPVTWPKSFDSYEGLPVAEQNVEFPLGFGLR